MRTLHFYYDYACPFCKKGYDLLLEVLPSYPDVELHYIPCEIHPYPELWGKYSDLLAAGYYIAREIGEDIPTFNKRMFQAATVHHVDIENIEVLSKLVADILDQDTFAQKLEDRTFEAQVKQNNKEAWVAHNLQAVPSFRMEERYLHAVPGYGIDRDMLVNFLEGRDITV